MAQLLKQYPAYKDSGIEWLGLIPSAWIVRKLKYSAKINPTKGMCVYSKDSDEPVVFLPMEKVNTDGTFINDVRKPIHELWNGFTYFDEDDVIIAKITPCFENGKGAYLHNLGSKLGFGSTEFHVLREQTNRSTGKYLFYISKSDPFRQMGAAFMYGAAGQKRVPSDFIEEFSIGFPPVCEQNSIADFLDRKTALIDDLIAKKQRQIELLKEQRQAVINQAVTKGLNPDAKMKDSGIEWLGKIPEHWDIMSISHFVDKLTNGYVGPTRDIMKDSGIPYIQGIHIKNNTVIFTPIGYYYVSEEWSSEHSRSILRENDVLVVQTGSIGDVGIVPKELECSNCHALIILRVKEGLGIGKYLLWLLSSDFGYHSLYSIKTGDILYHLNSTKVKDIRIPVAPINEQRLIISYIEKETKIINDAISRDNQQIHLLQEYRTALISEAVTGKIDVRASA